LSCIDIIRNSVWSNEKCAYYYAQNTFLYVRYDILEQYQSLKDAAAHTDITSLSRVHPRKWIEVHEGVTSLEDLVKKLPLSLSNFFVRLFRKIRILTEQ